ncbi:hypothetical protein Sar04_14990 [Salinispora arenicola]|uniref:Transposase DDE domain-containing protein n=1 Tax=Salinispora arenicola TaxID=168697 RepID=A0ABQ4JRQ6_SALAC|nr:hypothetical protein Sar04_14990 [Salinispora arenicola]
MAGSGDRRTDALLRATEGAFQATGSRPRIVATADGRGVVAHAGARLLADLADVTGLTSVFGDALAPLRVRRAGHDPGRVAVDVAVILADGGEAIADLAVLRDQAGLFGPVASDPTAWVLSGMDGAALARLRQARALPRRPRTPLNFEEP